MPLNPFLQQSQFPSTSQAAIREFNDRYLAALAVSRPTGWADTLGEQVPTDRPQVTFPVNQLRTQYVRSNGESHFHGLREASFDVFSEEFDAGYEAPLMALFSQIFAYRNWQKAPERLVIAEEQHRHNMICQILDGTGTRGGAVGSANDPGGLGRTCITGKNFFATNHPANIVDGTVTATWSNYQSTAKNILGSAATGNVGTFIPDYLQAEIISMQTGVLDENGRLLGANPDTILVPADYAEAVNNGLNNSSMLQFVTNATSNVPAAAAVDNVFKSRFKVVPMKEATMVTGSTADWYLVDSALISQGVSPWLSMRQTVPESLALRVFDESSDYFKNTGKLKLSSHIWYGFSLVFPHAIRRVKGPTR